VNRYKRGDKSPCGRYRFWAYRKDAEGWVSNKKYDAIRRRDIYLRKVAYTSTDLLKEERKNTTTQ